MKTRPLTEEERAAIKTPEDYSLDLRIAEACDIDGGAVVRRAEAAAYAAEIEHLAAALRNLTGLVPKGEDALNNLVESIAAVNRRLRILLGIE